MSGKILSGPERMLGPDTDVSENQNRSPRRDFLKYAGITAAVTALNACGGGGGGDGGDGGGGTPVPPKDTTSPGTIRDLYIYASTQKGESVYVEFTQPGDDGFNNLPKPTYLEIRVSDAPITNETEWSNALTVAKLLENDLGGGGSYFSREFDLSQAQDLVDGGLTSGNLYFAAKAVDEAGNKGGISTPENPSEDTAYIKSRAEFYVDRWLSPNGFNLDYDTSVLVIRGDSGKGIDSNSDALAQILINSDDSNGIPFASYATWQDIRDVLLQYTDGQPVVNGNSELNNSPDATTLNSSMLYNCLIRVWDPVNGEVLRNQKFQNLTQPELDSVRNLHRNALIQIVSALPENYDNLNPDYDPGW